MQDKNDFSKQTFFILFFIGIIAGVFVLKTLSHIILPVIFAVILGFVFLPVVDKMQKKLHFPWVLGSILVTLLAVIIMILLSSLLVTGLSSILSNYTRYEARLQAIFATFDSIFDFGFDEGKSFLENIWGFQKIRDVVQKTAITLSSGLVNSGKSLLTVFLLMAFFLLEMKLSRKKIKLAFTNKSKQIIIISEHVKREVSHFLSIKFLASLITGLIVFSATFIIGMDFPIVWGFLAFCMNFIPIFGSIISCVLTILFALIQFYPSVWQIILVAIVMLSVNMIIGNILEPKIEGEGLGISPFVILISLSLWGYIWGFLGMLLAVPMTVMIKITCEHIIYLKPVAAIIGNGTARVPKTKKPFHKSETAPVNKSEKSTE
ncbi:MAG: AI-2E family transporter [Treponema sp.]|nr:AI-2E family transporter [Treponema sp.]